jgi:hypothetical protein
MSEKQWGDNGVPSVTELGWTVRAGERPSCNFKGSATVMLDKDCGKIEGVDWWVHKCGVKREASICILGMAHETRE